jgi:hypothetical protein
MVAISAVSNHGPARLFHQRALQVQPVAWHALLHESKAAWHWSLQVAAEPPALPEQLDSHDARWLEQPVEHVHALVHCSGALGPTVVHCSTTTDVWRVQPSLQVALSVAVSPG